MHVVVTGSRDWQDEGKIWTVLDGLLAIFGKDLVIVHGACPRGADFYADQWAR